MRDRFALRRLPRWIAPLGGAALLAAVALFVWPMGLFAQEGKLSRAEAERIALQEYPDTTVTGSELEREWSGLHYSIELSNGVELEVDANDGRIGEVERGDDDGAGDDEADLSGEATLSRADAERIALDAHPGTTVRDLELDRELGVVIYSVELSNGLDLAIDATSGEILATEQDGQDD